MTAQSNSSFTFQDTDLTLTNIPHNKILLHSTNCFGEWGAGFALALHNSYPAADKLYTAHCDSFRASPEQWPDRNNIVGTCLLIPPQPDEKRGSPRVWIACLFTSYGYGRPTKKKAGKDSKAKIVSQTEAALRNLRSQLETIEKAEYEVAGNPGSDEEKLDASMAVGRKRKRDEENADGDGKEQGKKTIGDKLTKKERSKPDLMIYSPKFNSGSFGVKWEETEAMVQDVFDGWSGQWYVLAPPK